MRSINTFFTGLRRASHLTNRAVPVVKNYFFVDASVIIGYRTKQHEAMNLSRFIEDPNHQFLYTETVLRELQTSGFLYPEASDDDNLPERRFRFIHSEIKAHHKEKAIRFLHELWINEFKYDRKAIAKGFGLSNGQLEKFKKDLFVIFESGYTRYTEGVLPDNNFRAPPLITNNMALCNKFLLRERTNTLVKRAINLSGLEDLIPIQLLSDTVEAWENEQLEFRRNLGPS